MNSPKHWEKLTGKEPLVDLPYIPFTRENTEHTGIPSCGECGIAFMSFTNKDKIVYQYGLDCKCCAFRKSFTQEVI